MGRGGSKHADARKAWTASACLLEKERNTDTVTRSKKDLLGKEKKSINTLDF